MAAPCDPGAGSGWFSPPESCKPFDSHCAAQDASPGLSEREGRPGFGSLPAYKLQCSAHHAAGLLCEEGSPGACANLQRGDECVRSALATVLWHCAHCLQCDVRSDEEFQRALTYCAWRALTRHVVLLRGDEEDRDRGSAQACGSRGHRGVPPRPPLPHCPRAPFARSTASLVASSLIAPRSRGFVVRRGNAMSNVWLGMH